MIWQNPWAWLGLGALAIPIAVHLLARRRATRRPFPTLRFLEASSRLSVRRQRLTDLGLLAVRLGVLLAAVAALAQPFLMTAARRRDPGASLARAIVVDTSASMQRTTTPGTTAIAEARARAQSEAASAAVSRTIEAADLSAALGGAAAWLATQPGRHEVVLISDFQADAVTAADLDVIPAGTGLRTMRVAVPAAGTVTMPVGVGLTRDTHAAATVTADGTDAVWTSMPRADTPGDGVMLLAGPGEQATADAARTAAFAGGLPQPAPGRDVAIVFPGAAERGALLSHLTIVDRPWMFEAVRQIADDATIASAARSLFAARPPVPAPPPDRSTILARDGDGQPLVAAGAADIGPSHRLLVFSMADAGSIVSAALVAALAHATSAAPPPGEWDPATIPQDQTEHWDRAPTEVTPPAGQPDTPSDGRWLWAAAVVLLLAESWLRRKPRDIPATPAVHERVA